MSRFRIREGWSTIILTSILVWIAVWSIQQAEWADRLGVLNRVMLGGLVAGFVVSKWRRVPSPLLHLAGMVFGAVVVTLGVTSFLPDALGTRRERLSWLWDRAGEWLNNLISGDAADDLYMFVMFIMGLTFLLAYATIWFVVRARWIWAALIFPGLLLIINVGYSNRVQPGLVVIYLFVAIVLLARFYLLQRETSWRRGRVDYPETLPWRGMWAGSYLAVAVLVFGWALPVSAQSNSINEFWQEVDGPWRSVEGQFNKWFTGLRGTGGSGVGGFAAFTDSFEMGGPLRLSDAEVVKLTGTGGAPYLAAHRYTEYTGRGWTSNVDRTHPEYDQSPSFVAPQIELRPGESAPLPDSYSSERKRVTYTIELLRTRGNLVFAPEVFSSADFGANLLLPWAEITETVDIQDVDLDDLPGEIVVLAGMLKEMDLTPPPPPEPTPDPNATEIPEGEEPEPTPTPEPVLQMLPVPPEVRAEEQALAERGITVSWSMDPETFRVLTMTYTGTFPMFGDVEAVFAREGLEKGDVYELAALNTGATHHQLRQAMQDVPQSVTDRYLQLPNTTTERTRQLAIAITAGLTNQYDQAKAIEQFLREHIEYTEAIPFAPPEYDIVDYVLFEDQRGYCEYYASAFVVLARSLGIPARMVAGFYPTDERDGREYTYRELNAHAWPEVYFEGYGWIGFEPTAGRPEISRDPAERTPASTSEPTIRDGGFAGEGRLDAFDEWAMLMEENMLPTGPGATTGPVEEVTTAQIVGRVAIGILMLGLVALLFFWLRGMRGLTPAGQFYAKLHRGAGWGGVRRQPWMTPHEYANSIGDTVPGSRAPATFLTDLYVQETYGNKEPAQTDILRARQAWLRLRGTLLKHVVLRMRPWGKHHGASTDDGEDW